MLLKKLAALAAGLAVAALPLSTLAQQQVQIESQVNVANVTAGQTQYQKSVDAKVDEVVKVQVWYHNKEEADSNKVADNLKVAINLPSAPGKSQTVTSTVSSDNSNTVTDTANINLSLDNANLEYIPGSAQWRHNIGDNTNVNYVTQTISDNVVNGGVVLENEKPCFNFEATVTVLARVKAPVVSIVKQVKVDGGQDKYAVEDNAKPGDTLDYVLIVKNEGNTVLHQVQVADGLPPFLTYVPGSTRLVNSQTGAAGMVLSDEKITTGGITIADMEPGSTQYVYLKAKLADSSAIKCGDHRLRNSASVRAQGTNQIFNVAFTNVNVPGCGGGTPPQTPPTTTTPGAPLPQTGPESAVAGLFGTGAIGYAAVAWRRSKRALLDKLLNRQ